MRNSSEYLAKPKRSETICGSTSVALRNGGRGRLCEMEERLLNEDEAAMPCVCEERSGGGKKLLE